MAASELAIAGNLCQLLKEYADDYCLEVIRFIGKHPNTRFNGLAIFHALELNGVRRDVENALRRLIDKGIIRAHVENGLPLYCLIEDEPLRGVALDVAKLDWRQWQLVLTQIYTTRGIKQSPPLNPISGVLKTLVGA